MDDKNEIEEHLNNIYKESVLEIFNKDFKYKGSKEEIKKLLLKKRHEYFLKLSGFNDDRYNDYETWEVDHCNGRSGESIVGTWLKNTVNKEIEGFFKEIVEDKEFKKEIRKKIRETVQKDYMETVLYQVKDYIRQKAHGDAQRYVDTLTSKVKFDEKFVKEFKAIMIQDID